MIVRLHTYGINNLYKTRNMFFNLEKKREELKRSLNDQLGPQLKDDSRPTTSVPHFRDKILEEAKDINYRIYDCRKDEMSDIRIAINRLYTRLHEYKHIYNLLCSDYSNIKSHHATLQTKCDMRMDISASAKSKIKRRLQDEWNAMRSSICSTVHYDNGSYDASIGDEYEERLDAIYESLLNTEEDNKRQLRDDFDKDWRDIKGRIDR